MASGARAYLNDGSVGLAATRPRYPHLSRFGCNVIGRVKICSETTRSVWYQRLFCPEERYLCWPVRSWIQGFDVNQQARVPYTRYWVCALRAAAVPRQPRLATLKTTMATRLSHLCTNGTLAISPLAPQSTPRRIRTPMFRC